MKPQVLLPWLAAGLVLGIQGLAHATDYYVATTGNDSNPGTLEAPFATLQQGADVAEAGDTVYIRGGTYEIVTPATSGAGISLTKSGTSDTSRIRYWAYEGEVPVFDFANMEISTTGYTMGFNVSGSFLHIKGIEIKNVPMNTRSNNGMSVNNASNDIFELINFHHNNGTGLFIGNGGGGHLVLNCDSHDNYDPTSSQGDGQNADGFGLHYQTDGEVSKFSGCRAWWNSDDGYDFINQEVSGVIENSWAMGNGYINSGTERPPDGNGNGFKVGSSKTGVRHTVTRSLAWKNAASGFYANHSSGGNDWFNNTSYSNGTQYNMLASDPNDSSVKIVLTGELVHHMKNNIGFPDRNREMEGVDTTFNTWDLGIMPAEADFVSVDDTGFMGPRQTDGSLPNIDFMKLPMGSQMIDKGTDVSLPFAGTAPDLGAFEYGLMTAGGSGGTGGTGGSTGTAGASNGGMSSAGTAGASGGMTSGGGGSGGGAVSTAGTSAAERISAGDPGCACKIAGSTSSRGRLEWLAGLAVAVTLSRRRSNAGRRSRRRRDARA